MADKGLTSPVSIDPAIYRDVLGNYPTGVALITAIGTDGAPLGMVVGTFSSVSIEPALVSFMPDRGSKTFAKLREASSFCINVLAADQDSLVSSWRGTDSFADVEWKPAPSGAPILAASVAWIDCDQDQILEAGDHYIVLGAVRELEVQRPTSPLLFFQGGFGAFAPTSLLVPAEKELIHAARLSEAAMEPLTTLAELTGADVSLLAMIGDHDIVIDTVRGSAVASYLERGLRLPLIPPTGSVHLDVTDEAALDAWVARLPRKDEAARQQVREQAAKVAEQGYSLLLVGDGPDAETWQGVTRYIHGEATPLGHRQVLQMHLAHLDCYEPEIDPNTEYVVRSITIAVPVNDGPRLSVRLSFPQAPVLGSTVLAWAESARSRAVEAADLIHIRFGPTTTSVETASDRFQGEL